MNFKVSFMNKINIGIIGLGYWGPNFARIVAQSSTANLKWCCDLDKQKLERMKNLYPATQLTEDYRKILADPEVKAVIIATPAITHYQITKDSLLAGKDVLVEKPVDYITKRVEKLVKLSEGKRRILMVGHIFRFNPAVIKIKEYIDSGYLGKLLYFSFKRVGLGPIREDVNVMWDLAPHDISMLLYFTETQPVSIFASGQSYFNQNEDVVFLTIKFANQIIANLHLSWIDPVKIRQVTIVSDKKMAVFDDVSLTEKVKIFDKGVSYFDTGDSFGEFQASIRDGDILIPKISAAEPLQEEFNHFIDCIQNRKRPFTDIREALQVTKILEAAQKSLKTGKIIKITNL